jgi:hypothetical protein
MKHNGLFCDALLVLTATGALLYAAATGQAADKKPNILFIMGDDVGWFNLGAYHQGIMSGKTPNLDRLAREGMRFTDYYAEASCTAGRANFITGEIPLRTGLTTDEFEKIVKDWIATARHPQTKRLYPEMACQPMLELLAFLRASGFKTFIVSGGGIEFMRPWADPVYGIPPEQIVGSSIKTRYEMRGDGPVLVRLPEVNFMDDKEGKPIGINSHIGRRPIAAFGNSDGNIQMLEWSTAGKGARLALLVHHTDAEREYAYNQGAVKALDEAQANGWTVVDMKQDWKVIYPPAKQ